MRGVWGSARCPSGGLFAFACPKKAANLTNYYVHAAP